MFTENTTPTNPSSSSTPPSSYDISRGVWSQEEHDRFLAALQMYPNGPWKAVAEHVGTRSVRQVQTHAQKYHEKVARRLRGLRKDRKKVQRPEHRIDDEMMEICEELKRDSVPLPPRATSSKRPLLVEHSPPSAAAVKDWSAQLLGPSEETKLSESMGSVHVADAKEEYEAKFTEPATVTPPPAQNNEDNQLEPPSFYECIDYLIEALSSSESEAECESP